MGKRLGAYTNDNTKCMVEVGGRKLIDRALEILHDAGVSRVVMVVGYKSQNVKDYLGNDYKGTPIEYVDNPIYDRTNNIYSLYLTHDWLVKEDTILLESDLIYEKAVLDKLLADPMRDVALVDKYESWMDGTVVTIGDDRRITNFIDKEEFRYEDIKSYYKTVNIYKFSREFLETCYVPFLAAYSEALGGNAYYEQVLKVILHLRNSPLKALPLNGESWYEIDDVQDLDIAATMFAPSEEARYEAITSRYGGYWRYPHLLDFCYLVNPYFPTPRMTDEIKASFETLMRSYPSGQKVNALLASKNFGVKESFIAVGNGAAELIKSVMENFTGTVGTISPTFEEYPNRAARTVTFTPSGRDFHYTADDVKKFFTHNPVDILVLVNPDNPSGNFLNLKGLYSLVSWTKEKKMTLLIDESFVDFAESACTMLDNNFLEINPHVIVVKSISKSYGVPGLRLGVVASADTDFIARLKKDVAIWNINSFGEFYMQIFEKYHASYDKACELIRAERDRFYKELCRIKGLDVFPSQANYFLCEVKGMSSRELAVKLLSHGILIKDCSAKKAFGGRNFVRIAVRDTADNDVLIAALAELL